MNLSLLLKLHRLFLLEIPLFRNNFFFFSVKDLRIQSTEEIFLVKCSLSFIIEEVLPKQPPTPFARKASFFSCPLDLMAICIWNNESWQTRMLLHLGLISVINMIECRVTFPLLHSSTMI